MAGINPPQVDDSTPVIVAAQFLSRLNERVVMPGTINIDYKEELAKKGQVVDVPKRGTLTANDKASDADVTIQSPEDDKVFVTLNKHKEVTFLIEDIAEAFSAPDVMDGYMDDALTVLVEKLDADILALVPSLTSEVGSAGVDIGRTVIVNARKTLTDNKAPRSDLRLALDPKDEAGLLDDDDFSFAERTGDSKIFRDGALGRAFGFDFGVSTQIPTDGGSPLGTQNVAYHKNAFTLVVRDLPVTAGGAGALQGRANRGGISIRTTMSYNASRLAWQVTADILYGVKISRDELAVRVLS